MPSSSPASHRATVQDVGSSVQVVMGEEKRELLDEQRDCIERARAIAVIIALRLEEASPATDISATQQQEQPPPQESTQQSAHSPTKPLPGDIREGHFELGLAVMGQKSLDTKEPPALGPIASVRCRQGWSITQFSLGLLAPITLKTELTPVRITRIPFDLGVGIHLGQGDWSAEPFFALAFNYTLLKAKELEDSQTRARLEVGPRLGARVNRRLGAVTMFTQLDFTWLPYNYRLNLEPVGTVANTPHFWIGARLGFTFSPAQPRLKN